MALINEISLPPSSSPADPSASEPFPLASSSANLTPSAASDFVLTTASAEADWIILEDFVRDMIEGWRYKARVGTGWYTVLILLYASMILVGATGNLLVILVVVRNVAMRTARNVFIVNLAVSDLMLCLITMPLTLVEILYQTWQVSA